MELKGQERWDTPTPQKVLGFEVLPKLENGQIDLSVFKKAGPNGGCLACHLRNRTFRCGHKFENKPDVQLTYDKHNYHEPEFDPKEVILENRREGEPYSVSVSGSGGGPPPPPPLPPPVVRKNPPERAKKGKPLDFYFFNETNRKYYLFKFKNFWVIWKFSWGSVSEDAQRHNMSVTSYKKWYPGRISRDYMYPLRLSKAYTTEIDEKFFSSFKKGREILPFIQPENKEISVFNLLVGLGQFGQVGTEYTKPREFDFSQKVTAKRKSKRVPVRVLYKETVVPCHAKTYEWSVINLFFEGLYGRKLE